MSRPEAGQPPPIHNEETKASFTLKHVDINADWHEQYKPIQTLPLSEQDHTFHSPPLELQDKSKQQLLTKTPMQSLQMFMSNDVKLQETGEEPCTPYLELSLQGDSSQVAGNCQPPKVTSVVPSPLNTQSLASTRGRKAEHQRQEAVFQFDLRASAETTPKASKALVQQSGANLVKLSQRVIESKCESQAEEYLNLKVVNDLIYNEATQLVSLFKDYLIMDDINEFLKRPYSLEESVLRVPRLAEFYNSQSTVLPNYFALGRQESKFIFKNIHKKYRLFEQQQTGESETHHHRGPEEKLFDTKFKIDVANQSSFKDLTSTVPLAKGGLEQLVDQFMNQEQSFAFKAGHHQRQLAWSSYATSEARGTAKSLHNCSLIQSEFDLNNTLQGLESLPSQQYSIDHDVISIEQQQVQFHQSVRAKPKASRSPVTIQNIDKDVKLLPSFYNRPHKKSQLKQQKQNKIQLPLTQAQTMLRDKLATTTGAKQNTQKMMPFMMARQSNLESSQSRQQAARLMQAPHRSTQKNTPTILSTSPSQVPQISKSRLPLQRSKSPLQEEELQTLLSAIASVQPKTLNKVMTARNSLKTAIQNSASNTSLQRPSSVLQHFIETRKTQPQNPKPTAQIKSNTSPATRQTSRLNSPSVQQTSLQQKTQKGNSKMIQSLVTSNSKQPLMKSPANVDMVYLTSTSKSSLALKSSAHVAQSMTKALKLERQAHHDIKLTVKTSKPTTTKIQDSSNLLLPSQAKTLSRNTSSKNHHAPAIHQVITPQRPNLQTSQSKPSLTQQQSNLKISSKRSSVVTIKPTEQQKLARLNFQRNTTPTLETDAQRTSKLYKSILEQQQAPQQVHNLGIVGTMSTRSNPKVIQVNMKGSPPHVQVISRSKSRNQLQEGQQPSVWVPNSQKLGKKPTTQIRKAKSPLN